MATRRAATASTGSKAPTATSPAQRRTKKDTPGRQARREAPPAKGGRKAATSSKEKEEAPATRGRPPFEITEAHLRQIETLAGYGLTQAAIAAVIGVHPDTLLVRKKADPAISLALTRGKAVAEAAIGQALFVKAKAGDVKAITWWEMTRANRSARQHVQTEELPTLVVERE